MTEMAMTDVRPALGRLVREAAQGQRTTITDHGTPTAVIIGADELDDLEDRLALAELDLARAEGRSGEPIPHDEVKRRLGIR